VPLSLDGNTLHVACGYPIPKKELDEVGFLFAPMQFVLSDIIISGQCKEYSHNCPLCSATLESLPAENDERCTIEAADTKTGLIVGFQRA
jgi:hypothetical protein